jgi:spermidine synthase
MAEEVESTGGAGVRWGLFCTAFASLLFELTLTRILSVALWYNFAFLIISLALLGFGLSGVLLATSARVRRLPIPVSSLLFSASIPASYVLLNAIPFEPFSVLTDATQWFWAPVYLSTATLPFAAAGLTIGSIFNKHPEDMGRLYAWDLIGAALGAGALALIIPTFGGPGTLMVAGIIAAVGALLFTYPERGVVLVAASATLIACAGLSATVDDVLPTRITRNKGYSELLASPGPLHVTRWNTMSRIDVFDPSIWNDRLAPILIDAGTALTIAPSGTARSDEDLAPAFSLVANPVTLVLGSGGGREVKYALSVGAPKVYAVEVNPIINDLVTGELAEWTGHLFADPRVLVVTDEGRSYIERSDDKFDVIVSAHTISNAAVASGAMALSENYLLTEEAFDDYLDHLEPGGIVVFTRPEYQLPRLFALGRTVLGKRGVKDLQGHFLAYRAGRPAAGGYGFSACFVLAPDGFSPPTLERYRRSLKARRWLGSLYDPDGSLPTAGPRDRALIREILGSSAPDALATLGATYRRELVAPIDDRPFFNQTVGWDQLGLADLETMLSRDGNARVALEELPIAQLSLLLVFGSAFLLAGMALVVALILARPGDLVRFRFASIYFAALGFGFMLIEVAMIQKLTLFIGQPSHTLVVGLAGILVFSGIGSFVSYRTPSDALARRMYLMAGAVFITVAAFALVSSPIVEATIDASTPARIAIAWVLIFPPAFSMGFLFPMGMRQCARIQPTAEHGHRLLGFVWGVNGFFSVLGSVCAVILSMMLGFSSVLLIGAAVYAVAGFAGSRLSSRPA